MFNASVLGDQGNSAAVMTPCRKSPRGISHISAAWREDTQVQQINKWQGTYHSPFPRSRPETLVLKQCPEDRRDLFLPERIRLQCRRLRRHGLDPCVGRSPGGGHGNPLLYSCLENPMDRGAWQDTAYEVTKSQTRLKGLSTHAHPVS